MINLLKILLVEDELDIVELLEEVFQQRGHTVTSANTGNAAIAVLAKNNNFDLIISDFRMPHGNGLDVLKYVNGLSSRPFFIFLSGEANLNVEECLLAGADHFFHKPIDVGFLVREIERILKNHSKF